MIVHILMSAIVLLLAAVVVLQWQILRRKNGANEGCGSAARDEVLWSRGGRMTRRFFIPGALAGLVAMFVFRSAARSGKSESTGKPRGAERADQHSDLAEPNPRTENANAPQHGDVAEKKNAPQHGDVADQHGDHAEPNPRTDAANAPPHGDHAELS